MEDLRVKLPRKLRDNIRERFNYENARDNKDKDDREISVPCEVCLFYRDRRVDKESICNKCPFNRLGIRGCENWVNKVAGEKRKFYLNLYEVYWDKKDDKVVKDQLKRFLERVEELVEWVD